MSKQPPPIGLSVGRYRLRYARRAESRFPAFAGSAWRGAFGHALKRTVCVTRLRQCPDCLLYRSCVYPYIFETPPPLHAAKMRRYTAAPHPFVIEIPLADEPAKSSSKARAVVSPRRRMSVKDVQSVKLYSLSVCSLNSNQAASSSRPMAKAVQVQGHGLVQKEIGSD